MENQMLAALPEDEREPLRSSLTPVQLRARARLKEPGEPMDTVYFPTSGVVSSATVLSDGQAVEAYTTGYEGVLGVEAISISAMEAIVQVPGGALAMDAADFEKFATPGSIVTRMISRYMRALNATLAQNAACNRVHELEQRLARWLLMCHDRALGDELPLTQEFIALMLGVQRPSVTVAAGGLQNAGFIHYQRGRIEILDRDGLEDSACECYETVQQEFLRLLGFAPSP
jgi:CRP-like cAMP-binding protein